MIEQLDMFCAPDYQIGLIGACFLLGIVVGCATLARLGDVVGRKPIYLLGMVMHIGFMICVLITTNRYVAFVLLFFFGVSLTARYYVGYTYNTEIQPKSH
mmetsp:Transcript_37795/g.57859  ORF Transcript_37795/g.57859 Transcript_37795/m.57859 type:complete len:100 (-) Transcript_37795:797-1096(-)